MLLVLLVLILGFLLFGFFTTAKWALIIAIALIVVAALQGRTRL